MKPKILILYIDGFKYSYYTNMPFVKKLIKNSMYGKLQPELGYTSNLGAFFTGKKPEQHNYFSHLVYNRNSIFKWSKLIIPIFKIIEKLNLKKYSRFILFSLLNLVAVAKGRHYIIKMDGIPLELVPYIDIQIKKHYYEENCFKVENLFSTVRKNNLKFHFYMWPFYGTNNKTYFELPLFNNDNYRFKQFKKIFKKEGDVYFTQFFDLDKKGHFASKEEMLKTIKQQDNIIKYFVQNFKKRYKNSYIIIWTDHGMTKVDSKININNILKKLPYKPVEDYYYFLDSTLARFWFFNNKAEKEILKQLRRTELIEIDQKIKNKYGLNFTHNLYGDYMFTVPVGSIIFPDFFNDTKPVKAMHGYFPETESEKGFYLINSNRIIKGKNDLKLRELLPIIKKLLK